MPNILSQHRPDPKACAVARAVEDSVHPDRVILFGSRARGDFNADSDIDLLIVTDTDRRDKWEYVRNSKVAHRKGEEVYGDLIGVDLVHMSVDAFHDGRRARNHLAGQAVRDGYDANGDKVNYDNPEPTNWPDIRQRIANAERHLIDMEVLVEDSRSSQEIIGFTAQQAIENALKGWISALDADYGNTHDLGILMAIVRQHPEERDTPAGEQLTWLTKYAVEYRYEGVVVAMDDRFVLLKGVTETVHAIITRIRALTESNSNGKSSSKEVDDETIS